jgi:hypothetical protein
VSSQRCKIVLEQDLKSVRVVEAPGRVELPTNGLGNRCSIHLSYGADRE